MANHDLDAKHEQKRAPAAQKAQGQMLEAAPPVAEASAEPVGVLLQRARIAPGTLRPNDGRRLLGALGNHGFAHMAKPKAVTRIQPKLTVGPANDAYEREADQMADIALQGGSALGAQISRLSGGLGQGDASQANAQRASADGASGFGVDGEFEEALQRSSGGGSALPDSLRSQFEPAYGASFENVRVHAGPDSARLADSIQAKAFTHGSDIHFNAGAYDPGSSVGQRLLAHELTHVVQQGAAQQNTAQRSVQENAVRDSAQDSARNTVAVQRSPTGVIQRTGKKVNSLIAFWEEQKKANAPQKPPQTPPQSKAPDPLPDLGPGSPAVQAGSGAVATPMGSVSKGWGAGTPQAGTPFGAPSPQAGTAPLTHTPNMVNLANFATQSSNLSSSPEWSSSKESSNPMPVATPAARGMQFPGQTKYKDRLKVDAEYEHETTDSTSFVLTKVFQCASEAEFFTKFDEPRRAVILKKIGWDDADIAELELTKKSKVEYVDKDEERAAYALNLGATITQGANIDPFDTAAMFANGVGAGHAIFVMDPNGTFYAGRHKIGVFHHSSFLAGGAAASAGTVKVAAGKLIELTGKSGHYMPKPRQIRLALAELKDRGVSLSSATVRLINTFTFQLDPAQPAEDFLNQGITPDLGAVSSMSSSPATASDSSSQWSQSSISGGGGSSGILGLPASNNDDALEAAGGPDWKKKLEVMGFKPYWGGNWLLGSTLVPESDMVLVLEGKKTAGDF